MLIDLAAHRPKYLVQGLEFTVRETTPVNERRAESVNDTFVKWQQDFERRRAAMNDAYAAWAASGGEGEEPNVSDYIREDDVEIEGRFYFDLFCAMTEGPHEALTVEAFNKKIAEAVIADFFPQRRVTELRRQGFLPL